jgi:hypothetical protein
MTDRSDVPDNAKAKGQAPKPRPLTDEPGFVDGIPVEELVRLTREFTARITNEDRQRLTAEVTESGRAIQSGAPYILQQFFLGKIDLDVELMKRFPGTPLLSSASFTPAPGKRARRGFAVFKSQDEAAAAVLDLQGTEGMLEASFLQRGMIGVRFNLGQVVETQRKRFLDLMHRPNGIAILWTRERWESDYLVFVVRERFARIYAFGDRYEAACRLPPDILNDMVKWFSGFWATDAETPDAKPDDPSDAAAW